MATITTALSTAIGQVRLLIGDDTEDAGVLPSGGNFTDLQINYYLTARSQNVNAAAADLCMNLARRWNTAPQSFTADGLTVNRGETVARWQALAQELLESAAGGAFVAIDLDRRDAYSAAQEQGGVDLLREDDTTYTEA